VIRLGPGRGGVCDRGKEEHPVDSPRGGREIHISYITSALGNIPLLRSVVDVYPRGAAITKIVRVLVLVAILTATLAVSPAQACACGGLPNWSVMSDQEIVSTINGIKDEPRIMAAEHGDLPPAPAGYRYDEYYRLIPL
jgi:hypothetical protein